MAREKHGTPPKAWSLRGQQSVRMQWGRESELTACKAQIRFWEKKLETAQEGVKRQTAQVAAGSGISHSILASYAREVAEAKGMIIAFEEQAKGSQRQIDALLPDAAKAAERAEGQKILAMLTLERLELDRRLDSALEAVWKILQQRAAMTAEMREGAVSLEFSPSVNLDDGRFDALLRTLPKEMAQESGRWVTWFLGREPDRRPCLIRGGEAVLAETLASHNAFRPGDCPSLTKAEETEIERIIDSLRPHVPPPEPAPRTSGEAEEVPMSRIQWCLLR